MFEVVLSPESSEFYQLADGPLTRKLARCFAQLENDPRTNRNIKRLKGEFAGILRYRIGDWRVVYRIDDETSRVLILTIAHRREVYE